MNTKANYKNLVDNDALIWAIDRGLKTASVRR